LDFFWLFSPDPFWLFQPDANTPIANAVITLAAVLITTFLIPWIKRKATSEQMAQAQKWVTIAVEAAEMIYNGSGLGDAKKAYVKNFLETKGYNLDVGTVDAMIEAAVLEMKSNVGWA